MNTARPHTPDTPDNPGSKRRATPDHEAGNFADMLAMVAAANAASPTANPATGTTDATDERAGGCDHAAEPPTLVDGQAYAPGPPRSRSRRSHKTVHAPGSGQPRQPAVGLAGAERTRAAPGRSRAHAAERVAADPGVAVSAAALADPTAPHTTGVAATRKPDHAASVSAGPGPQRRVTRSRGDMAPGTRAAPETPQPRRQPIRGRSPSLLEDASWSPPRKHRHSLAAAGPRTDGDGVTAEKFDAPGSRTMQPAGQLSLPPVSGSARAAVPAPGLPGLPGIGAGPGVRLPVLYTRQPIACPDLRVQVRACANVDVVFGLFWAAYFFRLGTTPRAPCDMLI